LTNTTQPSGSVTTSAPGTPAQVGTFTVSSFGAQVTITEGAQAGWVLASATCKNASNTVVGTLSGSAYTIPASDLIAGAVITCDYTNRPYAGTVSWSKVDAGSTSTLLTGSEWTLTGPSYPAYGIPVADCTLSPCAGPDADPVAGQFRVPVLSGTHTLVEKTAPIGFQLDATTHTFAIATDGQVLGLGAFANKRSPVPALPLTGGASTDAFLLVGYALMAAAGFAGWRNRRRLVRSF
jgi:LPXTG-motif cell wall-anchored protein